MSGFDGIVSLRPAQITEPAAEPTVGFGELASTAFDDALISNPSVAYYRQKYLETSYALSPDTVDAQTARQRLKDEGIEGKLQIPDQGIPRFALDTLIDRKKDEIKREQVLAQAPGGIAGGSVKLAVGLGASLLDPLNVASAFVPVVGEARYAQLLARAPLGIVGRTAVRAGVGAVESTAGAAAIEPLVAQSKSADQADYTMGDSLANIAFGGVFGAGLHSIGGGIGELWRYARGSAGEVAANVDPSTRASALKTAIAQAMQGERVDVDPLVRLDPTANTQGISNAAIETRFRSQLKNTDAAIAEYAKLPESEGGRVLNTDVARELSPDYRADRTRSSAVHEPASELVKEMYARKLAEAPAEGQLPIVAFTAGGTGAGKSTAIAALSEASDDLRRAQIIYDTNMNTLDSSVKKIEQALTAGKDVSIMYVSRNPVEALTHGALPRAMRMGRTVPLVEHARTHAGSAAVIRELAERYKNDSRVKITVIDNTRGKGNARLGSIDAVRPLEYNSLVGELHAALETERQAGRISEAVYRGTRGEALQPGLRDQGGIGGVQPEASAGDGGKPEPANPGRIDLSAVRESASAPKLSTVADERASADGEARLKEAPQVDDIARVEQDIADETLRLKESGIDVGDELAPFEQAIKDADTYAKAARAAVICGLRHA